MYLYLNSDPKTKLMKTIYILWLFTIHCGRIANADYSTYWKESGSPAVCDFTSNTLFSKNTSSKTRCAASCSSEAGCQSWSIYESQCIGYNIVLTCTHNNITATTARYYTDRNNYDCSDLKSFGYLSGVYTIYPTEFPTGICAYCDMDTAGGGWTVIQNRYDGNVNFYVNWDKYKNGFGDLNGEFWLGNEYIYRMTKEGKYSLRIDLEDNFGNSRYEEYSTFIVHAEINSYRLVVGGYSGTAGDGGTGFSYNNNTVFSTMDRDATGYCTNHRQGGWWYSSCTWVNINGPWVPGTSAWASMMWQAWKGHEGMKKSSMKIRKK